MQLDGDDGKRLVMLARNAIELYLAQKGRVQVPQEVASSYSQKAGAFVTLNSLDRGEEVLRGCIGYPMPDKVLYDAVVDAAIASATSDPRFRPLNLDELEKILVEVSILTQPELITVQHPKQYLERIKVGRDGLIVHWSRGSGLLLPQVPVEYEWDEEQFLCETCMKAGAMPDRWLYDDAKVYRFEAMVFKEVAPNGDVVRVNFNERS